ncbi:hypothetical protein QAD02_016684 [Eretmocerus hayati]|uniref:Uncharacterized protein n=1 Tax=Eretmocerus hayati TaxID=131215 RepID=A0ACC2PBU1_9HYME|nr:hypothetical protein QAD02_016684 [Eretmocerus hayati]
MLFLPGLVFLFVYLAFNPTREKELLSKEISRFLTRRSSHSYHNLRHRQESDFFSTAPRETLNDTGNSKNRINLYTFTQNINVDHLNGLWSCTSEVQEEYAENEDDWREPRRERDGREPRRERDGRGPRRERDGREPRRERDVPGQRRELGGRLDDKKTMEASPWHQSEATTAVYYTFLKRLQLFSERWDGLVHRDCIQLSKLERTYSTTHAHQQCGPNNDQCNIYSPTGQFSTQPAISEYPVRYFIDSKIHYNNLSVFRHFLATRSSEDSNKRLFILSLKFISPDFTIPDNVFTDGRYVTAVSTSILVSGKFLIAEAILLTPRRERDVRGPRRERDGREPRRQRDVPGQRREPGGRFDNTKTVEASSWHQSEATTAIY